MFLLPTKKELTDALKVFNFEYHHEQELISCTFDLLRVFQKEGDQAHFSSEYNDCKSLLHDNLYYNDPSEIHFEFLGVIHEEYLCMFNDIIEDMIKKGR